MSENEEIARMLSKTTGSRITPDDPIVAMTVAITESNRKTLELLAGSQGDQLKRLVEAMASRVNPGAKQANFFRIITYLRILTVVAVVTLVASIMAAI